MNKFMIGPILTVLALVLVGALLFYFGMSLNRLNQRMLTAQSTIASDSTKINAIVNFFNANANPAAAKQ